MADKDPKAGDAVVIKKYANRRLYNTASSSYVTLENLAQMVKIGQDFVVYDAKSNDDITRSVLTQIIFEEEGKGQNLLPISFLRHLIRLYDDSLRSLIPGYLEMTMEAFSRKQEEMRKTLSNTFGELFPFKQIEEMGRQNVALFQQALGIFSPLRKGGSGNGAEPIEDGRGRRAEDDARSRREAEEIAELRKQMRSIQDQLDGLAKQGPRQS